MKELFVCGNQISYSRSPLIHNYWFKKYKIKGIYKIIDIKSNKLEEVFLSVKQGNRKGGNFTTPYKEAAFNRVEKHHETAQKTQAVNTVWLEKGVLWGANTDSQGFCKSMDCDCPNWQNSTCVLVLGAGGAARAIIYALQLRGIKNIHLMSRTFDRADKISSHFKRDVTAHQLLEAKNILSKVDLIINTIPALEEEFFKKNLCYSSVQLDCIFVDLAYNPLETYFLKEAKQYGMKVVNGAGMLLHQAALSFEYWFGFQPEITEELCDLLFANLSGFVQKKSFNKKIG